MRIAAQGREFRAGARIGLPVEILRIRDPRVELEEHYYNARHSRLLELGLRPHYLSEEFLESMQPALVEYHRVKVKDHKGKATQPYYMVCPLAPLDCLDRAAL